MSEATPRGRGRAFVLFVCALVIGVLFSLVLTSAWRDQVRAGQLAVQEERGVAYLHPLTALLGLLVQSQTAAVSGKPVDTQKLRNSVAAVGAVDTKYGAALGTSQRFRDLNTKTESALAGTGTPRDQYQSWSDVVALALDLTRAVGDNANITHDENTDSYYVAQAALGQLPDAMVQAGRAADLATLAGTQMLGGDDAVRAAVARYAVATDGEDATNGLNKSIASTDSHTLGSSIALQLDAFRSAVATFTPPTAVTQTAPATAAQLVSGSKGIFDSALPLAHALLTQLNGLLEARATAVAATRHSQLVAGAGVAAAYLLGLLVVVVRRRSRPDRPAAAQQTALRTAPPANERLPREPALVGRTPTNHRGAS